ncbi:MAG: hypothetical protein U5R49_16185 [Deltaproteobacteria bacterium]|nr:hypothetical protein [Deltaproteobacteria bacterium]
MFKKIDGFVSALPYRGGVKRFLLLACATLTLTACAAMQNREAIDTERLLAAAGFRIRLADTPEKLAHLESMTQRRLVQHENNGTVYYIYADAEQCKCMYAGNEQAYQRYQKLATEKQIAEDRRMAAEMNENAAMNWGMWGPWGPWGPAAPWD